MIFYLKAWWDHRRPRPIRRIQHHWQRARRGWSDQDWWSFDQYLARVIAEGCEKFRNDGMGYPSEVTEEEWKDILFEIETGFANYTTILDFAPTIEAEKAVIDQMQKSGELLVKWFPAMWD